MLAQGHVPLLLLCWAGVIFGTFRSPANRFCRTLICVATAGGVLVYLGWRLPPFATQPFALAAPSLWMWSFLAVEVTCLADFLILLLLLVRTTDYRREADAHERRLRALPSAALPAVDVWIATYNEEWPILEKTIVGALALIWPRDKLKIWILDDGRRPWLKAACARLGVNYLARPDNVGRKAGNHNYALGATSAPYILSLDADFVPFPNMIFRTVGFFDAHRRVAIVQTPQAYYNSEPMRSNLLLQKVLPPELDMFYRVIQPSRDAWNAAFYCGSAAMLRRAALMAIGGFEALTDIEDQVTSVKLLVHGWKTLFLAEQLSVGLAAESVSALHDQRNRWCRGSLQILFVRYGPFGRGLGFIQRLFFLQSYWLLGSLGPLTMAIAPMMWWWFGWPLFPSSDATETMLMPLLLFGVIATCLIWICRGLWLPIFWQASELFLAVELLPTAITTLIKPFGKSLIRIHPVTAKGGLALNRRIDVLTGSVLMTILLLTVAGLVFAALTDRVADSHPHTLLAVVFWTVYVSASLSLAALICFELPYHRDEQRFAVREPAVLAVPGRLYRCTIEDISLTGALLRLDRRSYFTIDQEFRLLTQGWGEIPATIVRVAKGSRIALRFDRLDEAQRHAFIRDTFANPRFHADFAPYEFWPVVKGVAKRFLSAA